MGFRACLFVLVPLLTSGSGKRTVSVSVPYSSPPSFLSSPGEVLFQCDYDGGDCDGIVHDSVNYVRQGGDNEPVRWQIHSGPTPTTGTGPSGDQSGGGSGAYAFFETSYPISRGHIAR